MSTDKSMIIETPAMIVTVDGLKASQVILLKRFYESLTGNLAEDLTEEVLSGLQLGWRVEAKPKITTCPSPFASRPLPPVVQKVNRICGGCATTFPLDGQHDCSEKEPHWLFKTLVQPIIDAARGKDAAP